MISTSGAECLLMLFLCSCRYCTDQTQHHCYLRYKCCCGNFSNHWHHNTCGWSPGWGSASSLHHQVPITELQGWVIFPPTAAGGWSRVWGGAHWQGDWTERECGLWASKEYWTESQSSLWACAALIFPLYIYSVFQVYQHLCTIHKHSRSSG